MPPKRNPRPPKLADPSLEIVRNAVTLPIWTVGTKWEILSYQDASELDDLINRWFEAKDPERVTRHANPRRPRWKNPAKGRNPPLPRIVERWDEEYGDFLTVTPGREEDWALSKAASDPNWYIETGRVRGGLPVYQIKPTWMQQDIGYEDFYDVDTGQRL
jgi:hypothetical protein